MHMNPHDQNEGLGVAYSASNPPPADIFYQVRAPAGAVPAKAAAVQSSPLAQLLALAALAGLVWMVYKQLNKQKRRGRIAARPVREAIEEA